MYRVHDDIEAIYIVTPVGLEKEELILSPLGGLPTCSDRSDPRNSKAVEAFLCDGGFCEI